MLEDFYSKAYNENVVFFFFFPYFIFFTWKCVCRNSVHRKLFLTNICGAWKSLERWCSAHQGHWRCWVFPWVSGWGGEWALVLYILYLLASICFEKKTPSENKNTGLRSDAWEDWSSLNVTEEPGTCPTDGRAGQTWRWGGGATAHMLHPPQQPGFTKVLLVTQMQIPSRKSLKLIKVVFSSPPSPPPFFSALYILNHQDLLMYNKYKNASLPSFAAKAKMIIKLNPQHMAWVAYLQIFHRVLHWRAG